MAIVFHSQRWREEWMNYIILFFAAALFSSISVSHAEARKFRLFAVPGFGGGETIDRVYDLPNAPPFLQEGKAFDLGYLNGSEDNAYVLYHGDRYTKLSDAEIATLKARLGFDPTARHRMEQEDRDAESRRWSTAIFILVLVGGLFALLRLGLLIYRWIVRSLTNPAIVGNGSTDAVDTPLEIRKKQLIHRHWSDTQTNHDGRASGLSAVPASSHAGTAAKTFGRRSA
ncbi:hypothetical protein [Rhizobium sp. AN70]|uniref:hypothetical protein n=2 Tax=unclassified Rhizobium TaxID=2613769 RepID=UPI00247A4082|nr:hypothetical protein [Rhizobium sp. AN70]